MTESVRWGVLGCANIAVNRVIPGIEQASLADLAAVASRSLPKAEGVAKQFHAPKAYGSYDELLADPDIEAIYIPLPNGLHAEWSIKAMRAGKDVLCEKPIAMDAAEARQIQAVRDETGRLCLEAFAYRFNPVVSRIFEITRSGVLGDLCSLHSCTTFRLDPLDPANVRLQADIGGGALYDVGCYALNAQRMMAGREPLSAWATMGWSDRFDVDLAGTAMLEFGEGLRGTVKWGFDTSNGSPLAASGTEGKLVAPFGWRPPEGRPALLLSKGDEIEEIFIDHVDDYMGEVQDVSEAIRGLREPAYAWEPLDANMRVIDACYRSQRSRREERV